MRLNLRAKLLLFSTVIAILPLVVAGQSLIRIARDEMKSSANEQLLTTARQVTDKIDEQFQNAWLAPLTLIRNTVDDPALGVPEKIAVLTKGIADLPDIVALQITVAGRNLPLIVSKDAFVTRLAGGSLDAVAVLRSPPETIAAYTSSAEAGIARVVHIPQTDDWLATIVLPLQSQFGGGEATFSARVNLASLRGFIADHPFQKTGEITVIDAERRRIFDPQETEIGAFGIVASAQSMIDGSTSVSSVETYQRPDGEAMLGAFSLPQAVEWAVLTEKSEHNAYFAVTQMIRSLALWLAVGIAVAAIGATLFALRISRPILAIGAAAIEVAKGNFRTHVTDVKTRDEIGDLAERFNTMIVQLNERFQLAKFVSGGTIAAIRQSDHEGVKLGGERREVAMLFADIRGYTSFAEKRDPELVVEVLNSYFQELADHVLAHAGDIDKYVGDQIMAVFHGDGMADNAVRAALEMQDVMAALGAQHPDWGLEIGVGVDLGDVVMGAMGSKERMDYTVLGDHVNFAARLCSAAKPREILISENVANRLAAVDGCRLVPLEPIKVKGKSEALPVFAVSRQPAALTIESAAG
jgi:adenylate cyclase